MRESNFAFPAQNKACVCITSQLYDRRALDTTSPLPLFNSLTHLTYLTSTSPRIREIMTMDGGLERLVRILHEFCICPPPPENPAILYGLTPPSARPPKLAPALNPHSFDKHAAYRFSLAFQCIVNIGVRGSEPIRSRVVQAGTLDVVGCILEAWLANKGFAVGPSSSATGLPRETREQRQQRRLAQLEQRQREEAAHLQRALQRQLQVEQRAIQQQEESMDYGLSPADSSTSHILLLSDSTSQPNSDTDASTDNSIAATPQETGTPTGSVLVPARDRSGTIIARPVWDQPATAAPRRSRHRELPPESPSDVSRAETETEDDGDIDMDRSRESRRLNVDSDVASASASPSPERRSLNRTQHMARRAVGIVSDEPATGPEVLQVGALGLDTDAHIIINEGGGVGVGDGVEVGVEEGIVSLEQNDDFAMGAPPGAPGAIGEGTTPRGLNLDPMAARRRNTIVDAPDVTPRAAIVGLPMMGAASTNGTIRGGNQPHPPAGHGHQRNATIRGRPTTENAAAGPATTRAAATAATAANILPGRTSNISSNAGHRDTDSGPYRDEDVLLSLQLLAYLSKYPHVRQAFYKPRVTFHPASVNLPGARFGVGQSSKDKQKETTKAGSSVSATSTKESFFRAFTNVAASVGSSRGKDKQPSSINASSSSASTSTHTHVASAHTGAPSSARQTNVFSLVERFTFKPSSTETDLPNPPPRLPPEIQYWAGVIMRNACRKDDSRGGIRQCANMMCGKWETYPREFAKCRRCRKAKYCGKECQSTAWSEGHRFWCSAKDVDEDATNNTGDHSATATSADQSNSSIQITPDGTGPTEVQVVTGTTAATRAERRTHRERGHGHGHHPPAQPPNNYVSPTTTVTGARAESSISRDRTVQPLPQHQHQHPQASHVRARPATTARLNTSQAQDPMNTSHLTFQIQGQNTTAASSSSPLTNALSPTHEYSGRRRAETITGATMPSSGTSSSGSTSRTMEVPPNVILPRITTQQPYQQQQDWPMGGTSPVPPHASVSVPSPSRRYRPAGMATSVPPTMSHSSLFDDGQDDMVLG